MTAWGKRYVGRAWGKIWLTTQEETVYALEKGKAMKALGASLFRDTAYGNANKKIDAIRAPENYLVSNQRGYDVTQDYLQVDDWRYR